jgi:predicted glycoside hydrolase/deacetylase ChbG (UPF0249 family)
MAGDRYLIVNADDFGQSAGINRGVVAAHESGIVTSASLMVRWPAAAEAAAYARDHPGLSVGLHLDLGEWAVRDGRWISRYEVVPADDPAAVGREAERQLGAFRELVGRNPSHLDSHQHVHRREPARSVLAGLAGHLGVPLRHFTPGVAYCGRFYGQTQDGRPNPGAVGPAGLIETVRTLLPGVTELVCHPATEVDFSSSYSAERVEEVAALCDQTARAALAAAAVALCSFLTFPRGG